MTIIEGIFHDICIALGTSENEVLGMGFQEKVNIMKKYLDYHFNHEYYSFKFRLLRNKVAHGLMDAAEATEITDLILLDVRDAAKLSRSMQIPLNQKKFFLHQALKEGKKGDFRYLIAFVLMKKTAVPEFYGLVDDEQKTPELVGSPEFWDIIDVFKNGVAMEKAMVYSLLKILKDHPLFDTTDIKEKRVSGLHGSFKNLPVFDFDKFIEPLTNYIS